MITVSFISCNGHTRTTQSLLPVTVRLGYVCGLCVECVYMYSFDQNRLYNYLFSSAVRAANSSLVCNVIVSARSDL